MQFPFGQWNPDAGELAASLTIADGVMPKVDGYGPAPALSAPADAEALPDSPRGVISAFQNDGSNLVYAFTETSAYELTNTFQWDEIGTGFSLPDGNDWSLVQFGNKLLASNTQDGLQQYDIEVPAGFSAIADAGDPRDIFVCANVVVALDCLNNDGDRDNRLVRTSAVGNQMEWRKTGADYQPLEDGGRLVGGVDLKNSAALIFQDNTMRLMEFGGASTGAFTLRKISEGRGSVGRRSITSLDGVCYWLSQDGFKSFSQEGIKHIGAGRIDDYFLGMVDQSLLPNVQGALDPQNKLVVWRYNPLQGTTSAISDNMIGYSWQFDKWFSWTEQTTYLSRISTPGFVLDAMDDFGPLDGIDTLLDSVFWQGDAPVFAALNAERKYATFSGDNYAATIQTGVSNAPISGLINYATPIDDASGGTLQIGVKRRIADPVEWKNGNSKSSTGNVPVRASGMNLAFRRNIPAVSSWSYARGIDYIVTGQGGWR